MAGLVTLLALGLVLAIASAAAWAAWSLTHPPRRTYASAVARGRPGEPSELDPPLAFTEWSLRSRGRSLGVWDVVGEDPTGPVVVMCHGWSDGRIGGLARVPAIASEASRIVLWDMPGHGDTPGICTLGTRERDDLGSLVDQIGPVERPLVLYGWSLGAGVCMAYAADDDRVSGVIAESPYREAITPARKVLHLRRLPHRVNLPLSFWVLGLILGQGVRWRGFDRALHAAKLRCPLLVLHGELDPISPPSDGMAIAKAASEGRFELIPGGSHNDLWTNTAFVEASARAVRGFIRELRAECVETPRRDRAVH